MSDIEIRNQEDELLSSGSLPDGAAVAVNPAEVVHSTDPDNPPVLLIQDGDDLIIHHEDGNHVRITDFFVSLSVGEFAPGFSHGGEIYYPADFDSIAPAIVDFPYPHITLFSYESNPREALEGLDLPKLRSAEDTTFEFIAATASLDFRPQLDLNGPSISGSSFSTTHTEDMGPVNVVAATTDISDLDSPILTFVTVSFVGGMPPDGAAESLIADTSGTSITAIYNPVTGILLLSGNANLADYEQVLRSVQYENTSQDPDTAFRVLEIVAHDDVGPGAPAFSTIRVVSVNDTPMANDDRDAPLPGPLSEVESNDSIAGAQDLEAGDWNLAFDPNIGDSSTNTSTSIPHITVVGSGDGTFDYYSFNATAGSRGIFDIDSTNFDTELFLYDSSGTLLASNDDNFTNPGAGGSNSIFDSFIEYTFLTTDTFTIAVGRFNSFDDGGAVAGTPPGVGDNYTLQVSIENHPLSMGINLSTDEDNALTTGNVLDNDTDVDGGPLSIIGITNSTPDVLIMSNGDGTFSYSPNGQFDSLSAGETMVDSFDYIISDGLGGTDSATVYITITGVNDAPIAVDDKNLAASGSGMVQEMESNDSFATAQNLDLAQWSLTYSPDIGKGNGNNVSTNRPHVTIKSDTGPGNDSFDYYSFTVQETGVKGIFDIDYTGDGTPFNSKLFLYDSSGNLLRQNNNSNTNRGAEGSDTNQDSFLQYTFSAPGTYYIVVGESGSSDAGGGAGVQGNVPDINDSYTLQVALTSHPSVSQHIFSTSEDKNFTTGNVLANDSDPEGSPLTVIGISDITPGVTVIDRGDGTFRYKPNGQFESLQVGETTTDTFTYTISDGEGGTASAAVTIVISGVNDEPDALDDGNAPLNGSFNVDEDGVLTTANVLLNDTDPESDPLSVTGFDVSGTLGNVSYSGGGIFEYDPDGNFDFLQLGETATDTFSYTISDGHGGTDTATVTVTIVGTSGWGSCGDSPQLAQVPQNEHSSSQYYEYSDGLWGYEDHFSGSEDYGFHTGNVLDNDHSDHVDHDDLFVSDYDTTWTMGHLEGNGDGTFWYHPAGQFEYLQAGETATDSFEYTVSDGQGGSVTVTATIWIHGVNDCPVACDDYVSITEDGHVNFHPWEFLQNDSDLEWDALSIIDVDHSDSDLFAKIKNNGKIKIDPDGQFDYLAAGESVVETIKYTISDGHGGTDTAEIHVRIYGVNDYPEANDDYAWTDEDTAFETQNVLDNDDDIDASDSLFVLNYDASGIVGLISESNGVFWYDPNGQFEYLSAGEVAHEYVEYTVSDGNGGTDTATLVIEIHGVNDAPVACDDYVSITEDGHVNFHPWEFLQNDSDPEWDALSIIDVDHSDSDLFAKIKNNGKIKIDPDGQFDYLAAGESAHETIEYTIADEHGVTSTASINVVVWGVNDCPIASDDMDITDENTPILTLNVLANDYDIDSSDMLFVSDYFAGGLQGNLSHLGGGIFSYDPNGQFDYLNDGEIAYDSFEYVVSDGNGGSDWATVTIAVVGVDDPCEPCCDYIDIPPQFNNILAIAPYNDGGCGCYCEVCNVQFLNGYVDSTYYADADGGLLLGTAAAEVLIGSDTHDIINGNGGMDIILADAGDDIIIYESDLALVDGGNGIDTLVINDDLNLASVDNLFNLEKYDLNNSGATLSLSVDDVLGTSDEFIAELLNSSLEISPDNVMFVEGGSSDTVALDGSEGWSSEGSLTFDGTDYTAYNAGEGSLLVESDINTVIS